MSEPSSPESPSPPATVLAPRRRLLDTTTGTRLDAYGPGEWGMLVAIALIFGSSFLLMDIGLDAFTPGVVSLARIGLGALTLAMIPRARRGRIEREDWTRVALLGIAWMGVPQLLFPIAQQWIASSVAGMINAAMPLTSAVWAAVLLRRLPGRGQVTGLLIGFAGIVAISVPEIPVGLGGDDGTALTALGTGLVVLAIVLYGLSANLAVGLQQRYGALPVLLRAQLAALVLVTPFGLAGVPGSRFEIGPALAMIPLGTLGTALAFVLMTTLIGRVGGPRGAVPTYFTPIVAIALGVALRGEDLHPLALIGTVLVLIGAWIATRREPARPAR